MNEFPKQPCVIPVLQISKPKLRKRIAYAQTMHLLSGWVRSGPKSRALSFYTCSGVGRASMGSPDCVSRPPPGICPVNRDTIDYLLSKNGSGNAIIIVVGGAAESLSSRPGKNAVTLRNRKGFVKLALRHG